MKNIFTLLFLGTAFLVQGQEFASSQVILESDNFTYDSNYEFLDFDGDGDLDILGGEEATIYLNDGANNYNSEISISSTAYRTIGDFNNDGLSDIVTSEELAINNGDGTFTVSALLRTDFHLTGDFNNDGFDDLVTWEEDTNEYHVFISFGSTDGVLTEPIELTDGNIFLGLMASAGDFNGDGNLDLMVNKDIDELQILTNIGDGTFSIESFETENCYNHLNTADLDNDGDLDLVWITSGSEFEDLRWVLNEGGSFGEIQSKDIRILSAGVRTRGLDLADYNNDGFIDIAISSGYGTLNRVRVLRNNSNGDFFSPSTIDSEDYEGTLFAQDNNLTRLTAVDYDADGNIDLTHHLGGKIVWFENEAPDAAPPTAAFSVTTEGLLAIFENESEGEYDMSFWDFGDGNTSTEANPSHTYSSVGDYEVCLTVSGPGGENTNCTLINLLSSNENLSLSDIAVYPNPFSRSIQIDSDALSGSEVKIVLTHVDGKNVFSQKGVLPFTLSLPDNLTRGAYFLSLYGNNNQLLQATKIIKTDR